jgi:hypothetical protein
MRIMLRMFRILFRINFYTLTWTRQINAVHFFGMESWILPLVIKLDTGLRLIFFYFENCLMLVKMSNIYYRAK